MFDGIKCYPIPTTSNACAYDITWDPIRGIETFLSNRVVLSVYSLYQFYYNDIGVTKGQSYVHVVTSLNTDGFHHNSATSIKGN